MIIVELPDWKACGYKLSSGRIADLIIEYVRYRDHDGNIPQPYLDIVSALSELAAYRRTETVEEQR